VECVFIKYLVKRDNSYKINEEIELKVVQGYLDKIPLGSWLVNRLELKEKV
jgi:hypothetical protein